MSKNMKKKVNTDWPFRGAKKKAGQLRSLLAIWGIMECCKKTKTFERYEVMT